MSFRDETLNHYGVTKISASSITLRKAKSILKSARLLEKVKLGGRGRDWEIECPDERIQEEVSKAFKAEGITLGGYRTGYGAWVLRQGYESKGDWNDSSSRHHYAGEVRKHYGMDRTADSIEKAGSYNNTDFNDAVQRVMAAYLRNLGKALASRNHLDGALEFMGKTKKWQITNGGTWVEISKEPNALSVKAVVGYGGGRDREEVIQPTTVDDDARKIMSWVRK